MGHHMSKLLHHHAKISPEDLDRLRQQLEIQSATVTTKETELESTKKQVGQTKEEASLLQQKVELLETRLAEVEEKRKDSVAGLQASITRNGEVCDGQMGSPRLYQPSLWHAAL
jgi:predicted  nucleic acid-binding Zn-ribbon protein